MMGPCNKKQNHRVVEVGRNLWRSSGPTPLLKWGHPEPVAQDPVQMAFGDGDSTTSLANLGQCSVTLIVTKCFPMFMWHLLCFSLYPSPLVLAFQLGGYQHVLAHGLVHPQVQDFRLPFPWSLAPGIPGHWSC